MPNPEESIPAEWFEIAKHRKKIFDWTDWSEVAQPTSKTASPKREALNTNAGETTDLIRQLADHQGVSILGARLRINAFAYRREFELTATLEAVGGRNGVTIARVDAWPAAPHTNFKARRDGALRHLPHSVDGHQRTGSWTTRNWEGRRSLHSKTCLRRWPLTKD